MLNSQDSLMVSFSGNGKNGVIITFDVCYFEGKYGNFLVLGQQVYFFTVLKVKLAVNAPM